MEACCCHLDDVIESCVGHLDGRNASIFNVLYMSSHLLWDMILFLSSLCSLMMNAFGGISSSNLKGSVRSPFPRALFFILPFQYF